MEHAKAAEAKVEVLETLECGHDPMVMEHADMGTLMAFEGYA